jgi:hypothetical protein
MDLGGRHGLIGALFNNFSGRVEENQKHLRVVNVLVKIQSEDLLNTSLAH